MTFSGLLREDPTRVEIRGGEGASHVYICGIVSQSRGTAIAKAPRGTEGQGGREEMRTEVTGGWIMWGLVRTLG